MTKYLIGIDEVGRGPIAGPVAVGAFGVAWADLPRVKKLFKGVKESKQLSEKQREEWFAIIQKAERDGLITFIVSFKSERIIDTKGLSYSLKTALRSSLFSVVATLGTTCTPDQCEVRLDGGLKAPPNFIYQKTIIKGDTKEMVIALASICAKVLRDRRMNALSKKHPHYAFASHKGYGTKAHYAAIKKYGLLPTHRVSFLQKMKKA